MSAAGWVAPPAAGRAAGGHAPARASEATLRVALARMPAFLAVAAFGAHAWAQMVAPAAWGAMAAALLAALAGGCALIAAGRRCRRLLHRAAATTLVAIGLLLVALAAAGVPGELAGPRAWDDLAAGISQGLSAVPNVRVPYSGLEEWTRIVIVLGCGALVGLAVLLAFAPRRGGRLGYPIAAAVVLTALYLVPVMQTEGENQFLGGAVFALLLALYLWLERVERGSALLAAGAVAAAVVAALVLAPVLDGDRALLDYERFAQSLSPTAGQRYDWNHDYGPLDWPRDAREVLRIRARERAYWKAANLELFDGSRWVQADEVPGADRPGVFPGHRDWVQMLRVTVRALRSMQFVAAGTTLDISDSPRTPIQTGPGVYSTRDRPLKRGNAYRALVYAPRPTTRELRAARPSLPLDVDDLTSIVLPAQAGSGRRDAGRLAGIPPWGHGEPAPDTVAALRASPYARAYELAQRLRASATTPYEYMRAVERHLSRGYTYSEDPPPSDAPLADFLFRDRSGYCQQFSGAMALLLRLGGVPARVAAGFAPGSLDRKRGEYVVRDLDAHSWVEVFYQGIGWVTRDPTPADSPARSQDTDVAADGQDPAAAIPDASQAAPVRPEPAAPSGAAAPAVEQRRSPALVIALAVAAALAAAGAGLALRRRRRRREAMDAAELAASQLAELRRALRRSGRAPSPPTTLEALAARYRGTAAEGYVRALMAARYGYGGVRPTPAQRAALRRELGSGLGLGGRLRAWWALPPRLGRT